MLFKKRNTNENGKSDDEYDEDELLEEEYADEVEDESEEPAEETAEPSVQAEATEEDEQEAAIETPSASVGAVDEDLEETDDEDEDEEEELNDADDEEERYLLSLARRSKWKKYTAIILVAVVVVGLVSWLLVYNLTRVDPKRTAMKVADTEIPLSEFTFNYFYNIDYFYNAYKDSLSSYGIDLTGDLTTQTCLFDQTKSWHQYFVEQAALLLQENVAMSEEALQAGMEYNEEDAKLVEQYFSNMEQYAEQYGVSIDDFVKSTYGSVVAKEDLVTALYRISLSQRFMKQKLSGFEISDEAIDQYYDEHRAEYETATYRMMIFSDANVDENDTRSAEEKANAMLAEVTDEQSFIELSREYATEAQKSYFENDDYTLAKGIYASQFNDTAASEWLFDSARKEGDKTVLELQSGYAVTFFLGVDRDRSKTIDVRHILVKVDDMEDADAYAAGKEEAERIYQEWKDGAATEDSFAALAVDNSDDGNASAGGLYTGVSEGDMVQSFNDWCFDPARKSGDSGIVETEYGFHVMYFVKLNEENWKAKIRSTLQNEAFIEYEKALLEEYPYTVLETVVGVPTR